MLIHVVRHTTPDVAAGVCYGQMDMGVADTFQLEQHAVINKLAHEYDALYCSPLKRCQMLAQTIQANQFETCPELMEVNFGEWEGIAWDEIPRKESQPWMDNFVEVAPPDGESLLEMQQRVLAFVEAKLVGSELETVAIVTHAGVIRLLLAWALSIPLDKVFNIKIDYGAVIEFNYSHTADSATVRFL